MFMCRQPCDFSFQPSYKINPKIYENEEKTIDDFQPEDDERRFLEMNGLKSFTETFAQIT